MQWILDKLQCIVGSCDWLEFLLSYKATDSPLLHSPDRRPGVVCVCVCGGGWVDVY